MILHGIEYQRPTSLNMRIMADHVTYSFLAFMKSIFHFCLGCYCGGYSQNGRSNLSSFSRWVFIWSCFYSLECMTSSCCYYLCQWQRWCLHHIWSVRSPVSCWSIHPLPLACRYVVIVHKGKKVCVCCCWGWWWVYSIWKGWLKVFVSNDTSDKWVWPLWSYDYWLFSAFRRSYASKPIRCVIRESIIMCIHCN